MVRTRDRRIRAGAVAMSIVVWLGTPAAGAYEPGPHYWIGSVPGLVAEWRAELEAADRALRSDRYQEARRRSQDTVKAMFRAVRGGPDAAPLLGLAVLFRALAEAGLGNDEEALWDWYLVQALHPRLAQSDLGAYGDLSQVFTRDAAESASPQEEGGVNEEENGGGTIVPPERLKARPPTYPPALSATCTQGTVVVRVILTNEGTPVFPLNLTTTANPIFVYSAFEALRDWRFKPARLEGRAIAVYYNLSVNFKSPRCQG